MDTSGNNIGDSEERLFKELRHVLTGTSQDHESRRIQLLEVLLNSIESGSLINANEAFELLVDFAIPHMDNRTVTSLVRDSLIVLIKSNSAYFDKILEKMAKRRRLAIILSSLVLELDYKKKRDAVKFLVDFLASQITIDQKGTKEVYANLLALGKQNLGNEIVKSSSPYLDSSLSKLPAIIHSLQLCSTFADATLTPKMLELLRKAMKGYFNGQKLVIYRQICSYIKRTRDPRSLALLLEMSKDFNTRQVGVVSAIASILDSNPSLVERVLEALYDTRDNDTAETYILALEKTKSLVDPHKLLKGLSRDGVSKYPFNWRIGNILARNGDKSKPLLIELLKDDDKSEVALDSLKAIGVKRKELSLIFEHPPLLQLYNFFYSERKKNPSDFSTMLKNPKKLTENVSGKPTTLDHLISSIFSCFNFVTLQVDASGKKGADIICFNPETFDIIVIGCTTGTISNDLKTMDALLDEMKTQIPKIFKTCRVKPIIISSCTAGFVTSDIRDATQIVATLLGIENINTIVEMLYIGKKTTDLLDYIEKKFLEQQTSLEEPYR